MLDTLKKFYRSFYYTLYGRSGKKIRINNEEYVVSAHIARGITDTIDEVPLKLLYNLAPDMHTFFDVGGNIGIIAIMLSRRMKKGTVIYSFEPGPLSFQYLQDTARVHNGNARIVAVNYAISNNSTPLPFVNDGCSCLNYVATDNEPGTIMVPATTIDAYCREHNVIPDVMKVDIEGAEYWALEGMKETLRNNDILVLVEIHQLYLADKHINGAMFGKIIDEIGYRVFTATGTEIPADQITSHQCVFLSRKEIPARIFQIN